jgi:hypothetical protein
MIEGLVLTIFPLFSGILVDKEVGKGFKESKGYK